MAKKKTTRWNHCNVLQPGAQTRRLWQFNAGGNKFALAREEEKLPNERFSEKLIAKSMLTARLNIAWLPADQVYLRVIQIPKSTDAAETQSMIELQLEKISPLPVNQIVWSFELIPQPMGDMQTAVVVIVDRRVVEELLGKLEGEGFLADRLEVPLLDQLRATEVKGDGVWIYPGLGSDGLSCMVAWWYAGILWNLSLQHLPAAENRAQLFREQLTQMTWAGELEGWLVSTPKFHVVADAETAAAWQLTEAGVELETPLPAKELAARTARRAAAANGVPVGLMPPEFTTRYKQKVSNQFGLSFLGAMLMLYLVVAAGYIGWTQIQDWRLSTLQKEVTAESVTYTNTMQIKERVKVLQEQLDLQWAALECYKAVAENWPEDLVLESLSFNGGTKMVLSGTAPSNEDRNKVLDFIDKLRTVATRDQVLFKSFDGPRLNQVPGAGGLSWNFSADLNKRADTP